MVCELVAGQLGGSSVVLSNVSMHRGILSMNRGILSMHCMTDLTLPVRHGRVIRIPLKKLWSD
jgi:hypothetical protein